MNSLYINPHDWLNLTIRLTLALIAGGVVGWNRQLSGKAAGLRTHMLVSLGAALFALVPLIASNSPSVDSLSRAIQGVATGIGFLGAGEILHQSTQETGKPQVRGLTSAAGIWVTAALGLIAGCGLWELGAIGTLMTLFTLSVAKKIEKVAFKNRDKNEI
ncbi:MgtC/SapB transporter [Crinalium epipsammum PCC 9333]|uniref:MgtC/SapB transporter n=1 Tax=Crinalium epipsammum PCC 9333 TaxID=1173022 RepID=K9W303_9CYAN|nr:MgtC/SapB family protein [Crinalium epipsammum]AFZ13815.1 MgtC/SapB transporter [Crinalium epipsammum PCC 9333]